MVTSDTIPLTQDVRLVKNNYHREIPFYSNNAWNRNYISTESWSEHVLRKILNLFLTHTLNIDVIPRFMGRGFIIYFVNLYKC